MLLYNDCTKPEILFYSHSKRDLALVCCLLDSLLFKITEHGLINLSKKYSEAPLTVVSIAQSKELSLDMWLSIIGRRMCI